MHAVAVTAATLKGADDLIVDALNWRLNMVDAWPVF